MSQVHPTVVERAGDSVRIHGEFEIFQGGKSLGTFRNKVVGQGLRCMLNRFGSADGNATQIFTPSTTNMRVGTGTGGTTDGVTALVTPNGTAPNSVTTAYDNPTGGQYRFKLTATWNAGALPAVTVTEVGVFADSAPITLGSSSRTGGSLMARLSASDSEFTSFLINTSVPLVIEWRMVLTFA